MNDRRRLKRPARHGSIGAAVACTASLGLVGLSFVGSPKAGAAHLSAGDAEVVDPTGGPLTSGGSSTDFQFKLPLGAACTGDSANGMYRIESYLVPQSVDLDTLKFDSSGPVPVAGEYRTVLYESDSNPYVSKLTAQAIPAPGPGVIIQPLPSFNFAVFDTVAFPVTPGTYHVGIACSLGPSSSATQLDKYWNAALTITADPTDPGPAKIKLDFGAAIPDTTTTTTTNPSSSSSTTNPSSSSTTNPSSSSTTNPSSSSTTNPSSSSTTNPSSSSTTVAGGGSGGVAGGGSGADGRPSGNLSKTGSSPLRLLAWSFVLLCLGRAAMLIGRRPSSRIEDR